MTTTSPARRFGRCPERGCKTRLVDNGQYADTAIDSVPRGPIEGPGSAVVGGNSRVRFVACAEHNLLVRWSGVKAKRNDAECGEHCRTAVVETCKCSCGGENHGSHA